MFKKIYFLKRRKAFIKKIYLYLFLGMYILNML